MYDKLYGMMNWPLIEGIEYTDIDNPSDILGQHIIEDGLLIQTFIPDADSVQVKYSGKLYDMFKMDDLGFYAVIIDSDKKIKYKLVVKRGETVTEMYDAYGFYSLSDLSEFKKFNAGIYYEAYDVMGAHKCKVSGVSGVRFCVWAPGAIRVSVIGDFNNWDGRIHQMSQIENSGVFEIFVPEIDEDVMYKYEIKKKGGENTLKADPCAFKMEKKQGGASIVADIDNYQWNDKGWMNNRKKFECQNSPISVYQFSISDFAKGSKETGYKDAAESVAEYAAGMGYTHVELMPVTEYFDEESLGYVTNFLYAPTNRYGNPKDLMYFVDCMHAKGIGVILDWSITGFATDETGMGYFDGTCVYESENPKRGINPRNGAHMYNYARPEVTNYLLANAFMWIDKYHMDGLNVVNAAEMLYHDYNRNPGEWEANIYGGTQNLEAIEFLKHFNSIIHKIRPGIMTIADETSGYFGVTGEVSEDCLGFDFKWNHEWRKDLLNYMAVPSYLRSSRYNELSLSMIYQYSDSFMVGYQAPEFINGKSSLISRMAGDTEKRKFDNIKLAIAYEYVHPGKKILFAGQDMAEYNEWKIDEPLNMELLKEDKFQYVNKLVKEINNIYGNEKALYELDNDTDGFEWINNISARESVLTFVRYGKDKKELLLVACNFDAVNREDYKIGVPRKGKYKEIFNSDNKNFGGEDFTNPRLKQSKTDECDGREESIRVNLAALSVSIYKFSDIEEKVAGNKAAKSNVAKKTTTKKKTTVKKEPAKKSAKKETEVKEVPEKETTIKETVKKKTQAKEVPEKGTTIKETVKKEAAVKETLKKETAATDVSEKEKPVKEVVKKEAEVEKASRAKTPETEASKKETEVKQTETVKKETEAKKIIENTSKILDEAKKEKKSEIKPEAKSEAKVNPKKED